MSFSQRRHSKNQIRQFVDLLSDRIVPAAVVLDLTTVGSEVTANGAILQQCDAQPTGTGVIRSFVRVQANGIEQGYNTDARPLQLNENKSPQFTRSLTLGQVPTVTKDGVAYRQFLLDINQSASSPYLSLDELRLYVGGTPNVSGYNSTAKTLGGSAPVFDLDGAGDVTVKLNYRLNAGSGAGDAYVLIPDEAFAGQAANSYVYLYSKFGGTWAGNAGFEEWAVRTTPPTGNPTGVSSLSGYVYFDSSLGGTRQDDEPGIEGITMQLQGTDYLGNTVVLTATTDSSGFYQFSGLLAGNYSIFRASDPSGLTPNNLPYADGENSVGSLSGTNQNSEYAGTDGILDISVGGGQNGLNYNFGFWDGKAPVPT